MPRGYRNAEPPPHGDNQRYAKHGCRCAPCTEEHRRRMNVWRMSDGGTTVDSLIPARKIRALVALGWTYPRMAAQLGVASERLGQIARREHDRAHVDTARRVDDLFRRLCMTPPPAETTLEKFSVTRAKNVAAANGWAPPLAWDDIDNPDEVPDMGARAGGADPLEWKWLVDGGENPERAAERLGVDISAISRTARRNGMDEIARLADRARWKTRTAA